MSEETQPKRLNYGEALIDARRRMRLAQANTPPVEREMLAWIEQYGLTVADKIGRAQWWLDLRETKPPPRDWRFAANMEARVAMPHAAHAELSEEQRRDFREFWRWYIPLEGRLIELGELLAFFHARPEHRALFDALDAVAHGLYARYQRWVEDGAIGWLPKRLVWRKAHDRTSCTVVEFLGRHLIAYSGEPPAHATERIPAPEPRWEAAF